MAAREGGGTKGLARGSGLTKPEDSDLDSPLSPRWRPFAPVKEWIMLENNTKTEPEVSNLDSPLSPRYRGLLHL